MDQADKDVTYPTFQNIVKAGGIKSVGGDKIALLVADTQIELQVRIRQARESEIDSKKK